MNRNCLRTTAVVMLALACVIACGCASNSGMPPCAVMQTRPLWKDPARWEQLKRGMTQPEVRKILGEPDCIDNGRWLVYWYYGPTRDGPQAMFNADSLNLDYWNAPAN